MEGIRLAIVTGARRLGSILLDLFYPPRCVGCGRTGPVFCVTCRGSVPYLQPPFCPLCGQSQELPGLCSSCAHRPLRIDGIRSVAVFEGAVRKAIHGLKYRNMRALAAPLGEMLTDYWQENVLAADVLVPVPLHARRQRERGYNQSHLLAAYVGQSLGIPVVCDVLRRNRYTLAQTRLSGAERRQNVAGAFACAGPGLCDKRVVLVDDVCTTGSTLEACSVALKAGGARSVWALTVARARQVVTSQDRVFQSDKVRKVRIQEKKGVVQCRSSVRAGT